MLLTPVPARIGLAGYRYCSMYRLAVFRVFPKSGDIFRMKKEDTLHKLMACLAVLTSSLLLHALSPSIAVAQWVTIKAQNNNNDGFSSNSAWQWAYNCVEVGDYLLFSNASGTWQDGTSVSGPGSLKSWPDNFLNLYDLGVGAYQATTHTPYWDALVGYIGDPYSSPPPERGSYTNSAVRPKAQRVFPVFPYGGTSSFMKVTQRGCLWLAFNADAYSNYTVDNSGQVQVFIQPDHRWRPNPDLGPLCQVSSDPWFQAICWVANQFVGGPIAR
jgi:hypothetical protein